MKALLIAIICTCTNTICVGVLVYNSPEMRSTVADGLDWTSEAIRPESDLKVNFTLPSINFN